MMPSPLGFGGLADVGGRLKRLENILKSLD
jgi:hypothetical protein